MATLPVPGVPAGRHDWSARRLRTSVLAAAALVVAVGVGSLAIDSRGSADLPLATGPGTPSATGVPPAADRDAHPEPAVAGPTPSRGAPSPTAPDPSSTTADLTPGTATPAPAPTRPAPNTPAAGPLAASPPGELVCPTHPPQVAVTATAVSPDLERVGGWVLVVRGTLEGHPDRDALVEQVLARITVHGSDIEAQALDAPLPVAAGDRLRWQAELRVPPGAAPPRPDAELGPWHWSDPGLAACP